ncbi:hypothetical protein CAPTEDRAFT_212922 [Capitella teleta]|uniref:Uncharacterized protein n=1 Tax=Capitella teleta TaxID=283909 RepID=R7TIT2_CAPTE|nr:hypothetical protein CAPTEDRAFT_212922 [Capitella teleta]|eukprot:ELT93377.1 hypothetical protein CAPTEDRAFT_212922 [Capitella teleta]
MSEQSNVTKISRRDMPDRRCRKSWRLRLSTDQGKTDFRVTRKPGSMSCLSRSIVNVDSGMVWSEAATVVFVEVMGWGQGLLVARVIDDTGLIAPLTPSTRENWGHQMC